MPHFDPGTPTPFEQRIMGEMTKLITRLEVAIAKTAKAFDPRMVAYCLLRIAVRQMVALLGADEARRGIDDVFRLTLEGMQQVTVQ
jgi:hypothetical protein